MRIRHSCLPLLLAFLASCSSAQKGATPRASTGDVLVTHARFLDQPGADAILIRNGVIEAVGSSETLQKDAPSGAVVLDARGGLVLPGFHDSHVHMMGAGMSHQGVDLAGLQTMDAALAAVKAFAQANPKVPFITGRGWEYGIVPAGSFPTRQQLDSAVPDRPAFLSSYDGHSGWANTKALALAGITSETKDPEGGRVVREADGKTPQGALLEGAQFLARQAAPKPDKATMLSNLEWAAREMVALGHTSVDEIAFDPGEVALLDELQAQGRLPLRVNVSLPLDGDLGAYEKLRQSHPGPWVSISFLKAFVDGVIESKTAYMLAPYEDSPGDRGKTVIEEARFKELILKAHAARFPVAVHAIGDGAVRLTLDAYEAAQKAHPDIHLRHRVEHIETVDPADMPRFKALGVVASMQPLHANPGGPTPDDGVWSKNLGPARLKHSFAWRELLAAGAPLAFGTDWPVMSANPLWGVALAVTRRDPNGDPKDGWNAHQTLTFAQAVDAYTRGSAYAVSLDSKVGTLQRGQWGDVVVLGPEVKEDVPSTLWKGTVRYTVVGGQVQHALK